MTVRELIEQIENYPDAVVNISMSGVFTPDCYVEDVSSDNILITETGL